MGQEGLPGLPPGLPTSPEALCTQNHHAQGAEHDGRGTVSEKPAASPPRPPVDYPGCWVLVWA